MRLRSRLLPTCAAALLALGAHAATPTATPVAAAPASAPVPLLWKVSDGEHAVYLLGSFHLLRPADYPLSPDVDAAFADAESLLFEIAPEEMGSPALAAQMGQAALRSDGTQLDSQLPAKTVGKLHAWEGRNGEVLQEMGLAPSLLHMFEPWFVGLTVSIVDMTQRGLDPKLGLDQHFAAAAREAGKPTAGLETGAQQIAFLDGMDKDEQLQFLDEALGEAADGAAELERLHGAWRRGDATMLWSGMAVDMQRQYPRLYRAINIDRNDAWVPKLEGRLKAPGADDTLVVVGALHLLGSDGVVEKLRAKGYTVERICSACAAGTK